tara:strand:- start:213 stop:374 length:162 start_codon:yes stop_codon:yes gene_type:complete
MKRPSQAEIDRVIKENKKAFSMAGVNINEKRKLTAKEAAKVNAALALLRSRKK